MEDSKHVKVRVGIVHNFDPTLVNHATGKFTGEFNELLYEWDAKFRELIIVDINNALDSGKWAIRFVEADRSVPHFLPDVYCDSVSDYYTIIKIVQEKFPDAKFEFRYMGEASTYIQNG
jgi:hypothetical protein